MNETMNLHEYYRNHNDSINASIMDIACDLAVVRLLNEMCIRDRSRSA